VNGDEVEDVLESKEKLKMAYRGFAPVTLDITTHKYSKSYSITTKNKEVFHLQSEFCFYQVEKD
jgi:hypothetical protein